MDLERLSELTYYRGRVALYALLRGLGIGEGDEVATQAFTCLAMPEGILATGAKPRFVDIQDGGVNMDPTDLSRRLTPRTKAIVLQHTFGIPAQIDELVAVARSAQLPIIEDCCHTYASRYGDETVGSFGVGAFYSFEWGKPIVAGVGGSAVVNDPGLQKSLKREYVDFDEPSRSTVGKVQLQYAGYRVAYSPRRYWRARAAFQKLSSIGVAEGNYHPTQIGGPVASEFGWRMAAPLKRRLASEVEKASHVTQHARIIAGVYSDALESSSLSRPVVPEVAYPVFARYPLLTDAKSELLAAAETANIEVADWYATPVHPLSEQELASVGYEPGSCPAAERTSSRIISLPVNTRTSVTEAVRIADFIGSFGG